MHTNSTRMEKELNPVLLKNETKNCIAPDAVFEEVNKNVYFQRRESSNLFAPEQLIPRRLFVVNGDIEVFDSMDPPQYSEIDKPSYRVNMEESARKGYVKLRLIEKFSRSAKSCETHTKNGDRDDQDDIEKDSQTESPSTSEEIYEYATIKELKTPKRINKKDERRDTIPDNCFCKRRIKKNTIDIDLDNVEKLDEESFYENVSYIRSKSFMEYFQDSIFPGSLARVLGFRDQEIENATSIPGAIFCRLFEGDLPISCEIVPSVSISWPAIYAFDFETRKRPTVTDKRKGIRYRWPTKDMVEEIKKVNSVLIPTGFMKKKDMSVDDELEWEISFPKAERYIEVRMSHAQIKCFLFLVTLHKTFIEPETAKYGLLMDHIRKHMYWECESNYRDWPEHRLGNKILKVIEDLNSCLSKAVMPDYFIKRKNVFENTPRKYLFQAQKVFHEVLQAPVMYFIKALRNLRYLNRSKFYPEMDFDELYKILTTEGAKYVNPLLMVENTATNQKKIKKFDDAEHVLKNIQYEKSKEKRKIMEKKKVESATSLNNKRKDSINLGWICEKKFDMFKTRSILVFFIRHFIEIAKTSLRFRSVDQSRFYLKQAWYLTKILGEIDAYKPDALMYQEAIAKEEDTILRHSISFRSDDSIPPTPTRNLNVFFNDFTPPKPTKENLSSPNRFIQKNTSSSKIKRHPSNLKTRNINRSVSFVDEDDKRDPDIISKKTVALDEDEEQEVFITSC